MDEGLIRMLCQMAIVVFTMITAFIVSKEGRRSNTKRKRKETRIVLVIAFVLGIVNCYFLYKDYRNQLVEDAATKALILKRNIEYASIIKNQKLTIDTANGIIGLQRELNIKNDQVITLQRETLGNLTGDKEAPILKLFISKPQYNGKPKSKYYIINFDIINNSKFPLHDVRCSVLDVNIPSTLLIGIRHTRGDEGTIFEGGNRALSYLNDYNSLFLKNIGSITKGNSYILHTSTIKPDAALKENYSYIIKISWSQGDIIWYLNLNQIKDSLLIKNAEFVLNGKKIDNYKKYIQYLSEN